MDIYLDDLLVHVDPTHLSWMRTEKLEFISEFTFTGKLSVYKLYVQASLGRRRLKWGYVVCCFLHFFRFTELIVALG